MKTVKNIFEFLLGWTKSVAELRSAYPTKNLDNYQ